MTPEDAAARAAAFEAAERWRKLEAELREAGADTVAELPDRSARRRGPSGGSRCGWVAGFFAAVCFSAGLDRLLKARRVRRWQRESGERLLFEAGSDPDPVWRRRAVFMQRGM